MKPEFDKDTEQLLGVDENALDKECIRLPKDYWRAAYNAAQCKRDVAEAEAELEVVVADLGKHVRDTPGKFGLDKVTEAAVKEVIRAHKEYLGADKKVREEKHKLELANALVWAMDMKKRSITNLVELHGMGYFAKPKLSERGREMVDNQTKRASRQWRDG